MASVQMMISANMAIPKIVLSGGLPARTRRSGIRDSPEAINRVDAGRSESLLTVPPVQDDTFMLFSFCAEQRPSRHRGVHNGSRSSLVTWSCVRTGRGGGLDHRAHPKRLVAG